MNLPPLTRRHYIAIGLGVGALVVLSFLIIPGHLTPRFISPPAPEVIVSTGTIKEGDVLARVLARHGLSDQTIFNVQKTFGTKIKSQLIRSGTPYEIATSTDGVFLSFSYRDNPVHAYHVTRSPSGVYAIDEEQKQTVWIERRIVGTVTENMYKDLLKQGYPEPFVAWFTYDLADNIMAWRIDFFTEQRPGDTFDALIEQEYEVGHDKPISQGRGRILIAKYNGKATKVKENVAVRFQTPGSNPEYYDPEGNAVRRAFLRAPFTHGVFRISSGFNLKRMHPILRTYRPHHGTDYAAARGTPVAAIGKGAVIRASWYKGYGNCIEVRHSSKFVSRYGHLSKIAVRVGQSVNQGQYIGNVGSTGLSTGPHLHFEMLVNGEQRNFLTMTFPAASAVAKSQLPEFFRVRDDLTARLNARTPDAPVQAPSQVTTQ